MTFNDTLFDGYVARLIKVGVCPYRAYEICKEHLKRNDIDGLKRKIAIAEVMYYDDTREYVD